MKVLVSGISSFTGPYLAAELIKNGHEVVGLSANLLDPEALKAEVAIKKPEAVVHLASITFVAHGKAEDFYHVNLLGTRNLLEALSSHAPHVKSLLLVSSGNVYGASASTLLSEDTPPRPTNDYAVSKLAMEFMAQLWTSRLPLFIVRPFNYTGVGQSTHFLIPKILSHFKDRKECIALGNVDVSRDFSDVRSVVQAYRKLLDCCPVGQTINICSGISYSLRNILDLAERLSGHSLTTHTDPTCVRINDIPLLKGDNKRLKGLIGDWASPSLEEILRWMLNPETSTR